MKKLIQAIKQVLKKKEFYYVEEEKRLQEQIEQTKTQAAKIRMVA